MLGEITHATAWWVGDWWIYGEHRYGERKVIVEADNRIGPRRKTETHAATAWPSSRSITASHLPAANAADVVLVPRNHHDFMGEPAQLDGGAEQRCCAIRSSSANCSSVSGSIIVWQVRPHHHRRPAPPTVIEKKPR
jgi:hypothetical protein